MVHGSNKVNEWLIDNVLSLNIDRTVCVTFGNYIDSIPISFKIEIENETLKRVNKVKYLGIIVNQHLRSDAEIDKKDKRLKYTVLVLAKLKKNIIKKPTNYYVWNIL